MAQKHALRIAKIGLSMPHGSKREEIDLLLELPQPYFLKIELLSAFAMTGEVLSAEALINGFNELLELGKEQPWRLEERQGEIMKWLQLFPFSNEPSAIFEIMDLLPNEYRYPHQLRPLLVSLGQSPHEDALDVLNNLLEPYPSMVEEYEWLEAILQLETEKSAWLFLELVCSDKLGKASGSIDRFQLSKKLAQLMEKTPLLRDEILRKYKKMNPCPAKSTLEASIIESMDASALIDLIHSFAADGQPYDGRLSHAIEKLALGQRPVDYWPGAFEQFSTPLIDLRKKLFDIQEQSDSPESSLAESCLIEIEILRDEYGRISNEPRHPDISSGKAWPREASIIN